jgi:hypothetical protein
LNFPIDGNLDGQWSNFLIWKGRGDYLDGAVDLSQTLDRGQDVSSIQTVGKSRGQNLDAAAARKLTYLDNSLLKLLAFVELINPVITTFFARAETATDEHQ